MTALVLMMIVAALATGLAMEAYKKVARKDRASAWESRLVALVPSTLFGFVLWRTVDFTALSPYLVQSAWMMVPCTLAVYILQLPACMKLWKPLLKRWLDRRLK